MLERKDLLVSIATTIEDYRKGEIPPPNPDHIDRWIGQFNADVQVPLLRELDFVLNKTYFSKNDVTGYFSDQIKNPKIVGDEPKAFWRSAHLFDIQQHGHSQTEILKLFGEALEVQCGMQLGDCGRAEGPFVYLDDALFSGQRIGNDLSAWIQNDAPDGAEVHIIVIATHSLGKYQCAERLKRTCAQAGKAISFRWSAPACLENRLARRNISEVLWPTEVPANELLAAYMSEDNQFPFQPRQPGGQLKHAIFSSEENRQLLEREMLLAGVKIRSFSRNPSPSLRPLGFSAFGLGFGSMIVTFRNCPNNTPLALWWGDHEAAPGHPFRNWYPLLPRKTYGPAEVTNNAENL